MQPLLDILNNDRAALFIILAKYSAFCRGRKLSRVPPIGIPACSMDNIFNYTGCCFAASVGPKIRCRFRHSVHKLKLWATPYRKIFVVVSSERKDCCLALFPVAVLLVWPKELQRILGDPLFHLPLELRQSLKILVGQQFQLF